MWDVCSYVQRIHQSPLPFEVKAFNPARGFGFITCDSLAQQGYGDVFVHQKHIGEYQATLVPCKIS